MLFFTKRKYLENEYKKWIKENSTPKYNVADTSFNVITFLEENNLLDEKAVNDFLSKKSSIPIKEIEDMLKQIEMNLMNSPETPEDRIHLLGEKFALQKLLENKSEQI